MTDIPRRVDVLLDELHRCYVQRDQLLDMIEDRDRELALYREFVTRADSLASSVPAALREKAAT